MTSSQPDHPLTVTRRHVLMGGATLAGTAALALAAPTRTSDVFTELRDRWTAQLVGAGRDTTGVTGARARVATRAAEYLARTTAASGSQAFDDLVLDPTTRSSDVTESLRRLRTMAVAWATPHTSTHRSSDLLDATLRGLGIANDRAYGDSIPAAAWTNWWDREIGCPGAMADCLVLLHGSLGDGARTAYSDAIRAVVPDAWHYDRSGPQPHEATGANLVDLSRTAVIEGIAVADEGRIADGVAALQSACRVVDHGDGLHADGSFIQHSVVPYTGAYGVTWLDGVSRLALLLTGTPWELDRRAWDVLQLAVDRSFSPVIHDGRLMSFVRGREISREQATEHTAAATVTAAILRLTESTQVPPAVARAWRGRCLGWVQRSGPGYDPLQGTDVPTAQAVGRLRADGTAVAAPEPNSSMVFGESARAVHRRSDWAFAVSMSADHVARYESMNGENLQGFHTGAGMTYLYDGDDTQFTDQYWPTVDPYHLPGTTVVQTPLVVDPAVASPRANGAWAGGAALDNYAAPTMSISAAASDLTGQASWFCFDDYVLALGTGIRCSATDVVETTVENRLLHDNDTRVLAVDGQTAVAAHGEVRTWDNPRWAHLEGVGGYVFIGRTRLRAERQHRSGRWRDINESGDTEVVTRAYLSLVIEHGAGPADAGYAYLVAPGATAAETAALAERRDVWVRAARPACHAVSQDGTGTTMVTFWQPGETPTVRADAPCSAILRETADGLALAVADLARRGQPIRIVLSGRAMFHAASPSKTVSVRSVGADLEVTVFPAVAGSTVVARLMREG